MKVPAKFKNSKKSFVQRLVDNSDISNFGSFCAFPSAVQFNGQDQGENVILVVRQHPAVFWPSYLAIIALIFAPFLFWSVFSEISGLGGGFMLGITLLMWLVVFTYAFDIFLKWYYSVNIVTDERIVDVDFISVLFHRFSEAQLEKIEDVSHAPVGILSSIFDYGDVYIQTAATKPEFDFIGVPKPREIQDTLLDLLEMKQKGMI